MHSCRSPHEGRTAAGFYCWLPQLLALYTGRGSGREWKRLGGHAMAAGGSWFLGMSVILSLHYGLTTELRCKRSSQTKRRSPAARPRARKSLSLPSEQARAWRRLPRPAFPRILLHRRRQSLRVRGAVRAAMPFDFDFTRSSIIQDSTSNVGGDGRGTEGVHCCEDGSAFSPSIPRHLGKLPPRYSPSLYPSTTHIVFMRCA